MFSRLHIHQWRPYLRRGVGFEDGDVEWFSGVEAGEHEENDEAKNAHLAETLPAPSLVQGFIIQLRLA